MQARQKAEGSRMLRRNPPLVALIAVAITTLATIQFCASVTVRAHARPFSWMRHMPPQVDAAVDRLGLRLPLPETLRLVAAREALARGDTPRGEALAAALPASNDRLALAGDVAQARGDARSAARAYLAAGDLDDLEDRVAVLAERGDLASALTLQTEAIGRLGADRTQAEALAQAYLQLGLLRQALAYRYAVGSAERWANALRAERAYARAVAIAPLDERYLLALGNQRLNLGNLAAAEGTFVRARDANPNGAAALTGLGEVALRRGDRTTARAYLARARSLDANSDAVRRFAAELGA